MPAGNLDYKIRLARQRGIPEDKIQGYLSQKQQNEGILTKVAKSFLEPVKRYGELVGEAAFQVGRTALNPVNRKAFLTGGRGLNENEQQILANQPAGLFLKDKELSGKGLAKTAAQRTAGAASFALPVGKTIKGAAALGAGSGLLMGLSQEGATTESVLRAGLGGGVGGAALPVAGRVLGAGKRALLKGAPRLTKLGEDIEMSALAKGVGRPTKAEGGKKFLKQLSSDGFDLKDADSLATSANNILKTEGPKILNATQKLTKRGVSIPTNKLTNFLEKEIANSRSEVTKAPLRKVLETIRGDLAGKTSIGPDELLLLRQEYGPLGKWSATASKEEQTIANAWEKAYTQMNNVLDDTLKNNGFAKFRAINKKVSTAIKAKNFAERVGNVTPTGNPLGLLDAGAGILGGVAGGPAGIIAGYAGKKFAESPRFRVPLGRALQKFGQGGAGSMAANANGLYPAGQMVGRAVGGLVGGKAGNTENNNEGAYYGTEELQHDPNLPQTAGLSSKKGQDGYLYHSDGSVTDESGEWKWNPQSNDWEPNAAVAGAQTGITPGAGGIGFSPSQLAQAMVQARIAGDSKAYAALQDLYSLSVAEEERTAKSAGSGVGKASAKDVYTAQSGLDSLETLKTLNTPSKLFGASLPLALGARDLKHAQDNVKDVLVRLRSGAAITDDELKYYQGQIPQLLDPPEVREQKLVILEKFFSRFAGSQPEAGVMQTNY